MNTGLEIIPIRERHYGRWVMLFLAICSSIVIGWYGYQWYMTGDQPPISIPIAKADPSVDESDISPVMLSTYQVPANNPRFISIESINVPKTRIYPVGLTDQNVLSTPRNIKDAAWYKKSATPGTGYGAILINAHNGGISKDGAFAKLSELQEDDEITVERGDGQTYKYLVVENQTMSLEEANKSGMKMMMESANADREGLNLITCAGKWIPRLQQFDQRVMVRAVAKS